jgi:hypothetical protein
MGFQWHLRLIPAKGVKAAARQSAGPSLQGTCRVPQLPSPNPTQVFHDDLRKKLPYLRIQLHLPFRALEI